MASDATAERFFSLVYFVKTEARNRTQLKLLDTVIRIRAELLLSNKRRKDFVVSEQTLDNSTIKKVYECNFNEENLDLELLAI